MIEAAISMTGLSMYLPDEQSSRGFNNLLKKFIKYCWR